MSYFDIVLLFYYFKKTFLYVEQNQNDFITSKMSSIFKINFWIMEDYTTLLNRNEETFLIFQTALKVLLSLLGPLTFYVTVTIHPKSHALMAKNGHLLFNIP